MSLIVLEQGQLAFGGREILGGLSLRVGDAERIGLVGPNGSGKSTLLKVLCGRQGLDGGQVRYARHCRIAYLPQDILEVGGETLLGAVLDSVPGRGTIEGELAAAEQRLADSDDPDEQLRVASVLAGLHERLERYETYFSAARAQSILSGLGFREIDFGRPTSELSGGWKMRAALAGLLFQDPEVLFLDEPTNHLDVPSVAWLDGFLAARRGSLVLICHDREFLNRHIERVVAFEPEGMRTYRGNYDEYKQQRAQEEEVLEASARNREREIKELSKFVERFRYKATKARQAQSRTKQIEKIQKEIQKPIPRPKRMSFRFPPTARTGRDVLMLDRLSKRFGGLRLFEELSRGVHAGDRIAIIGVNGIGKTTLLKMMAGELEPDAGEVKLGSNVQIGYYAQHHTELLDPRHSVLEEVWRVCPSAGQGYVQGVCGAFLFSGADVEKAVGVLSGGERARVLLARLLCTSANLLLMDEPTNHLDTESAEALAAALKTFDGTLVFVSHNSSFINHLATKVWNLEVGGLVEYPGNLADFMEHQRTSAPSTETVLACAPAVSAASAPTPDGKRIAVAEKPRKRSRDEEKERRRREAEQRRESGRRTRAVREEISSLEQRINALEAEQKELEPRLADPQFYQQVDLFKESLRRYETNRQKIEELYSRWEHQQEKLAELEELHPSGPFEPEPFERERSS